MLRAAGVPVRVETHRERLLKVKRGERNPGPKQIDKILQNFRAKWPDEAQWPTTRAITMDRNPRERR